MAFNKYILVIFIGLSFADISNLINLRKLDVDDDYYEDSTNLGLGVGFDDGDIGNGTASFEEYIELITFSNYKEEGNNVTLVAHFRGDKISIESLQENLKFQVKINNLDTPIDVIGQRDKIDIIRSYTSYKMKFTKNVEDIESINLIEKFIFSDSEIFESEPTDIKIYQENIKINNKNDFIFYGVPTFGEFITENVNNSFQLDFFYDEQLSSSNFTNESNVILSYIPRDEKKRDKINCTLIKYTSNFSIICKPKKDIYTYKNTLIMNTQLINKRRLRFLEDKDYQPIYTFGSSVGSINYKYNPEKNPYSGPSTKGLSAGVIAAIVLCSIAVVVAIGLVIFFLNKHSVAEIKGLEKISANSTSNINN